ncbi:polymorphic toxin-type HINT domain-containing protein [Moraxella oblonga]|uniref:polymorphic toxin-type HINT domain-containing protein n=1 Tax=Moraxella oblonga TaxID=200413 RepID=UPI002480C18D|nr:polymorphic toxin-type HINT domain-containing protein [Moraxella oblonga]
METLETTAEHPFWIKDTGWLKASLLEQSMILLDRNNQEVEVLSQFLIPNHTDTVYNIEVDDFHTYHVGRLGVWVHNADCCDVTRANLESQYGKLDNRYFGNNGEIYWVNPLTNKTEQINKLTMVNGKPHVTDPLTGKLEDATKYKVAVDHILPKQYFKSDPRFSQLPKEVQDSIMNSPENLQPMLKSANSSKGSKTELSGTGWDTWKDQKINSGYKTYLKDIQIKINKQLQDAYKKHNIK